MTTTNTNTPTSTAKSFARSYNEDNQIKRFDSDMVTFVSFTIKTWSGKLSEATEAIGTSDKDGILTLQKLIAPKHILQPFLTIRSTTANLLDRIGARFELLSTNIWVVAKSDIPEVKKIIKSAEAKFDTEISNFKQVYDAACDEYYTGKEYETQLRQSKLELQDVLDKFSLHHTLFELSGDTINIGNDTVFQSFVESIAEQAKAISNSLAKRKRQDKVSPRSIEPFFDILSKAKSFAYVSPHAKAIQSYLEDYLKDFDATANITNPQEIATAVMLAQTLSDTSSLLRFSDFLTETNTFADRTPLDLPDAVLESFDISGVSDTPVSKTPTEVPQSLLTVISESASCNSSNEPVQAEKEEPAEKTETEPVASTEPAPVADSSLFVAVQSDLYDPNLINLD